MIEEWNSFLLSRGAHVEDSVPSDFGGADKERQCVLNSDVKTSLSHMGVITVSGDDAAEFLQGQLTNDIQAVTENSSQLSAYCSPKGRVLALFRIHRHTDSYHLCLPRALLEPTLKRLNMYVLRAKVVLADASNTSVRIAVSGAGMRCQLEQLLGAVPQHVDEVLSGDDLTVLALPGLQPRYEIIGSAAAIITLWDKLEGTAVGAPAWELLDILAGQPQVWPATRDEFVPQMINLDLLSAINFKKGCYTGQEIVARVNYLGKLKRRMYLAHIDADQQLEPGAALIDGSDDEGRRVGSVVSTQRNAASGWQLLAVVQIALVGNAPVHLGARSGPLLHFETLPYAVD
ncbi:MAG: folate-binding protein YgfZ [Gammaproteobacteria bacterium]|nr:folate-binding protein YgfZ [Gammaproteobacteria bacterium]